MYSNLNASSISVHIPKINDVRQNENIINNEPTAAEVYQDLSTFLLVSYVIGLTLFVFITIKFILYIPNVLRNTPKQLVSPTLLLCGIYTLVAGSSLTSMLVPKALIFCESVNIVCFGICAYQFFCLCVNYVGGETNFAIVADNVKVFNMRTPPCCCCCGFIHPLHINHLNFIKIRLMILQLPFGLGLIYFMLNVIYLEDSLLYNKISFYFMPFMGISLLVGIWGLQISSRMFTPLFLEFKIMPKYICMQLILLICKLQPLVAQIEFSINGSNPADYPITKKVFSNVIVQLLIIIECALLSCWAHHLYKSPSKDDNKTESPTC